MAEQQSGQPEVSRRTVRTVASDIAEARFVAADTLVSRVAAKLLDRGAPPEGSSWRDVGMAFLAIERVREAAEAFARFAAKATQEAPPKADVSLDSIASEEDVEEAPLARAEADVRLSSSRAVDPPSDPVTEDDVEQPGEVVASSIGAARGATGSASPARKAVRPTGTASSKLRVSRPVTAAAESSVEPAKKPAAKKPAAKKPAAKKPAAKKPAAKKPAAKKLAPPSKGKKGTKAAGGARSAKKLAAPKPRPAAPRPKASRPSGS